MTTAERLGKIAEQFATLATEMQSLAADMAKDDDAELIPVVEPPVLNTGMYL